MKVRCLIIDDEPLAINVIKNYLQQIESINLVDVFNNAIDALNFLENQSVDLIFLDINMPILDGLNFIKSLESPPLVIITSAYHNFAIESYELNVLDYLVKPIEFHRFMKAINKVHKTLDTRKYSLEKSQKRPYIFIRIDKKTMKKVFLDEILIIECLKDYLKIITTTGRHIIHSTLQDFTKQLPSRNFIRIHRSYTIAIDKIETIEGNSVEIGGLRYVIGRSYIDEVKSKILDSGS